MEIPFVVPSRTSQPGFAVGPNGQTHPRPRPQPQPQQRPVIKSPYAAGIGFRPDIQGLRAVAVLLVLASHAGLSLFAGGYVGVDVFFVLSGFLITSLLVKEMHETGRISIAGFFARRARRILPAASLVLIATLIASWVWFPVTRIQEVMQDAFMTVIYIVNYRFVVESVEYLNADAMPSPFQQYWSLAVEEQFYMVWPLLLLAVLALAGRNALKATRTAVWVVAGVIALSLVASVAVTQAAQPVAYFATHTRVWELAAGAIIALTLPTWKRVPGAVAAILALIGLAAIVAAGVLYDDATPFPGYTAMLPVVGTMLVIVAGTGVVGGPNVVGRLLSTAPFQFVGKISYSLYLWHWPILIIGPLALGVESSLMLNLVLLMAAFAISQLSYAYVETPVRNGRLLKSSSLWGLVTGICCSLLSLAVLLTLTVTVPKTSAEPPAPVEAASDEAESLSRLERAALITAVPDDLNPSLLEVNNDQPVIYDDGCHLDFDQTTAPDHCIYGAETSDVTVVLIGDSHAAQWFPALERIAEDEGWQLIVRTKSACTPVSVPVYNSSLEQVYWQCSEWRENVFNELDRLRPDLVVLGSTDSMPAVDGTDAERDGIWLDGWSETLERVLAVSGEVVAIADTPWGNDVIPDCVALHPASVDKCNIDPAEGVRKADRRTAAMALQQEAGVTVIDPLGWFCLEDVCPVIVDSILVFRDKHHVSTPYMLTLTELFKEELPGLS
jgi:peptidoglycan/LPS O-acetylase OafA/YrhL